MCSRIIHLFCSTTMDRASLFNHSIKDFSQLLKSSTSPVQCTSPFIVLQTCKRYTSFSARINNLNRPSLYTLNYQPIFAFSSLNQMKNLAQSFLHSTNKYQMTRMMSQRSFSSQRGSHKRTGSHPSSSPWERANRTTMTYITALAVAVVGLSYAAVPLYRIFCQASGYGGTVSVVDPSEKVESMEPVRERELTIRFNADTSAAMRWQFRPHQKEIKLVPGETALAFYTARNPTDKPVTGIATYNVIPFEAGLYFNKIQCFCFEEQRLNPREQVDMPVFFYIDPEFNDDPVLAKVDTITLSYTFFESKEGEQLSLPLPQSAINS